jgi:hypothetical protein
MIRSPVYTIRWLSCIVRCLPDVIRRMVDSIRQPSYRLRWLPDKIREPVDRDFWAAD